MLGKKASPGPLFCLLDMARGSLSPECECWSVVQNTSVAIVFTLTFAPVLHSVSFDTYSIVIVLTSGHAAGWINTSVSCLVKLPLLFLATLTLVSLVLWVSTKIPTSLQLSWLVDRHGVFMNDILFRILLRTLLTSIKHNTNKQMYLQ